jgi:hypothetical protein
MAVRADTEGPWRELDGQLSPEIEEHLLGLGVRIGTFMTSSDQDSLSCVIEGIVSLDDVPIVRHPNNFVAF